MPADERHVVEDPEPEGEKGHQVQVEPESIADERQQDRDDRVDEEAADEDAIVVDPIELRTDRSEHRIERGEDGHGRVPAELEADVDVEDEARQDAHEEPEQGKQHVVPRPPPSGFGKAITVQGSRWDGPRPSGSAAAWPWGCTSRRSPTRG